MLIDSEETYKILCEAYPLLQKDYLRRVIDKIPTEGLWEYKNEHTRMCKNCRMTYISYNGWKGEQNEYSD